jgi:hypothetical protein
MKRLASPLFILCCLPTAFALNASATKLDLFSNVEMKAANYQHLIYGDKESSQPLYSEDATLGFVIKNIRLEKAPESSMDVGIVLQSVGSGASTSTITSPQFADAVNRLPASDGTPFVREAYVKIYKFLRPNVTATFGRQDFTLGQGIALASDDLGLPGGRLEVANLFHNLKADLFVFRPFLTDRFYKIYGGSAYYPGNEGLWQVYHFWQSDDGVSQDILFNTASKTKKFTGVRYFLSQSQLTFDGEAVLERGTAKKVGGGSGSYSAHAFMMKGAWNQDIPYFGKSRLRLGYGHSSGNAGTDPATATDKNFFPAFGHKYNGLERDGYGAIAGASLYDILKTSGTANGLSDGMSGLNVIDIGADMPYKKLLLSADLYKFRASENTAGGSLQIGSEWDLKATYPFGDNLRLNVVYAVFTPLGVNAQLKPIKLTYGSVSARF